MIYPYNFQSSETTANIVNKHADRIQNCRLHVENAGYFFPTKQQDPILIFIFENRKQIQQKANKFNCDFADTCQDVCLIFLENISKFDSTRGTLKAFIFGHLEKMLRRQAIGPLRFALSLDDDDGERIQNVRERMESKFTDDNNDENIRVAVPGANGLKAIAEAINARSARELGNDLGLTKRRINQMLSKIISESSAQFDFNFTNESI